MSTLQNISNKTLDKLKLWFFVWFFEQPGPLIPGKHYFHLNCSAEYLELYLSLAVLLLFRFCVLVQCPLFLLLLFLCILGLPFLAVSSSLIFVFIRWQMLCWGLLKENGMVKPLIQDLSVEWSSVMVWWLYYPPVHLYGICSVFMSWSRKVESTLSQLFYTRLVGFLH